MNPISVINTIMLEVHLVFILKHSLNNLLGAFLKDDLAILSTNTADQIGSRNTKPLGSYRTSRSHSVIIAASHPAERSLGASTLGGPGGAALSWSPGNTSAPH